MKISAINSLNYGKINQVSFNSNDQNKINLVQKTDTFECNDQKATGNKKMSELEKMQNQQWYIPFDSEIREIQKRSRNYNREYNNSTVHEERKVILKEWLGGVGEKTFLQNPIFIDFGKNLYLGNKVYFNANCTVLDSAKITVGDDTLIGPGVQLCTPSHPINPEERKTGKEIAKPIVIGKNCWIGAGAIILGGVEIGDNSVIGAGSVVTKNIPAGVVAYGSPARPVKSVYDEQYK